MTKTIKSSGQSYEQKENQEKPKKLETKINELISDESESAKAEAKSFEIENESIQVMEIA